MIRISVKKNVFICLVIAIIFILSLYQYCENNPEKCFYLDVADAPKVALFASYIQENASVRVSGHANWLPEEATTAIPTTIDTLQNLLAKDGRVRMDGSKSRDAELKRIERVDMEEVQDEEEEREEAKLLGIDKDNDNKSLGYREADFVMRDFQKEISDSELKRNQERNWQELRHTVQNLGRYERVDKTIIDPGSMTKEELEEYYDKAINSSSLFLIAVSNKTRNIHRGYNPWNGTIEALQNKPVNYGPAQRTHDSTFDAMKNRDENNTGSGLNSRPNKSLLNATSNDYNLGGKNRVTHVNKSNTGKYNVASETVVKSEPSIKRLASVERESGQRKVQADKFPSRNLGQQDGVSYKQTNATAANGAYLLRKDLSWKGNESDGSIRNTSSIENQATRLTKPVGTGTKSSNYVDDAVVKTVGGGSDGISKRSKIEHRSTITIPGRYADRKGVDGSTNYKKGGSYEGMYINVSRDNNDEDKNEAGNEYEDESDGSREENEDSSGTEQNGNNEEDTSSDKPSDSISEEDKEANKKSPGNNEDESETEEHDSSGQSIDDQNGEGSLVGGTKSVQEAGSTDSGKEESLGGSSEKIADSSKKDEEVDELEGETGKDDNDFEGDQDFKNQKNFGLESKKTNPIETDELDKTDSFEEQEKTQSNSDVEVIEENVTNMRAEKELGQEKSGIKSYQISEIGGDTDIDRDDNGSKMSNSSGSFSVKLNGTRRDGVSNKKEIKKDGNWLKLKKFRKKIQSKSKKKKKQTKSEERNWLMFFKDVSCLPLDPKLLLYNRIFKTGSTSINKYLKDERRRNFFHIRIGSTEDWYKTGDSYPYPRVIEKYGNRSMHRRVYTGHFFFRNILKINRPYTYINQVREPFDRILSHYVYMRNSTSRPKARISEMIAAGEYNETLRECFEKQHRGCENNVMTHFLCGDESFCSTGSEKAIQRAKYNMLHYFAAIGLTEHLDLYLKVLRKRLPKYFRLSQHLSREKWSGNAKLSATVPEDLKAKIKTANFADYQIYEYAKYLFKRQLEACKIRTNY